MEKELLVSLVTKSQAGDSEAMNELFNSFYHDLYYFALKTVKDDELALDITQEAFIEIINTISALKEPAAFVTWAKQITYHQCTRYFKKKKDVIVDEDDEGNTVFDTLKEENTEFIPDEALDQSDFKKTILAILDQLSEEQRSATMMYYFDEMSVKEIAQIQGVSEGTIKSRLNYSRKAIKASVEEYEKKNNIKLHAVPCLPLIKWLFSGAFEGGVPAASATAIAEGVAATTGAAISVTAATTAATATSAIITTAASATGIGAKIAALPIVSKIIAAAVAGAVVIGGSSAAVIHTIKKNEENSHKGNRTSSTVASDEQKKPISSANKTALFQFGDTIAAGCQYTLYDGTILKEGDSFPKECTSGDKFTWKIYTFYYQPQSYKALQEEKAIIPTNTWIPTITITNEDIHKPSLPKYINKKPVYPYYDRFLITKDNIPVSDEKNPLIGPTEDAAIAPTGFVVPENATYICADGTKYATGQVVPSAPIHGDTLKTEDYIYKYTLHYYSYYNEKGLEDPHWDSGCSGWSVRVTDTSKTKYSEILTVINGEPIGCMHNTFAECRNMKYSPAIPSTVTDLVGTYAFCESLVSTPVFTADVESLMYTFTNCSSLRTVDKSLSKLSNLKYMIGTFQSCSSLAQVPQLPESVLDITNLFVSCTSLKEFTSPFPAKLQNMPCAFSDCRNLTTVKYPIPESVSNMTSAFVGCSALSGEIKINAKALTLWDSCFTFTVQKIILSGSSPYLEKLCATATDNNVTTN